MGDLHHLHDEHEQAQMLLPWHVNGTLEPAEAAWFEAHLAGCAECRADLETQTTLRRQVAALPVQIGPIRTTLFERIGRTAPPSAPRPWSFLGRRIALGWALAGQAAFAAIAAALLFTLMPRPDNEGYRLLGSSENSQVGNAMVLFAPETTERELREALIGAGARFVDGPTASGAYVVRVADDRRTAALNALRQSPSVILAEPIDAGGAP